MKKSERLPNELIYLKNKQFFNLKDLMEEFNISRRTAIRDIESLENLGLAIYSTQGQNGGYYILDQELMIPIQFTENEIHTLFYALKALESLTDNPFDSSYVLLQNKLKTTLNNKQLDKLDRILSVMNYYSIKPLNQSKFLTSVLNSIINETAIEVEYKQFDFEKIVIQVSELFYRQGIWFFSAYDFNKKAWRTLRTDAILNLKTMIDFEETLSLNELKTLQKDTDGKLNTIPFRCLINKRGVETFKKSRYPNMHLITEGDKHYIVGYFNPEEITYMAEYMIKFGKNIVIESPPLLKEKYFELVKDILDLY